MAKSVDAVQECASDRGSIPRRSTRMLKGELCQEEVEQDQLVRVQGPEEEEVLVLRRRRNNKILSCG